MAVSISQLSVTWQQILKLVEKALEKDIHSYEAFFAESKLHEMTDNTMTIVTNSILCQRYLSSPNHHLEILKNAIKKVTKKDYKLVFVVQADLIQPVQQTNTQNINSYKPEYTFFANCKINPKYTFDNFVVGECNKEAVRAAILDYLKKNGREEEFEIKKCNGCCKACDHAH